MQASTSFDELMPISPARDSPSSQQEINNTSAVKKPGFHNAFERFVGRTDSAPPVSRNKPARRKSEDNMSELRRYLMQKKVTRSRSTDSADTPQRHVTSCSIEESQSDATIVANGELLRSVSQIGDQSQVVSCYNNAKMHSLKLKRKEMMSKVNAKLKGMNGLVSSEDDQVSTVRRCANCRQAQRRNKDPTWRCTKHRSSELNVKFSNLLRQKQQSRLVKNHLLCKLKNRSKLADRTLSKSVRGDGTKSSTKSQRPPPQVFNLDTTHSSIDSDDDVMWSSGDERAPSKSFFIDSSGSPTQCSDSTCDSDLMPLPVVKKKRKWSASNDMGYSQPKKRRKKSSLQNCVQQPPLNDTLDPRL